MIMSRCCVVVGAVLEGLNGSVISSVGRLHDVPSPALVDRRCPALQPSIDMTPAQPSSYHCFHHFNSASHLFTAASFVDIVPRSLILNL